MKPNLISGTYTSAGTVGVIYADTTDDLSGDEYIGVDKRQLASGSVAYLKNQDTLVMDSTHHWVTDDGTVIDNYVKDWVIPMQKVTLEKRYLLDPTEFETSQMMGYDGYGFEELILYNDKVIITFDDVPYIIARKAVDPANDVYPYYGGDVDIVDVGDAYEVRVDFSEYPFTLVYDTNGGMTGAEVWYIVCKDSGEHTIAIEEETYAILENVTLTSESPINVVYDGVTYVVSYNSELGAYYISSLDLYISYGEEWHLDVLTTELEHTIGAYVMKKETSGETIVVTNTFTLEDMGGQYGADLDNIIPMLPKIEAEYDGVKYELQRKEFEEGGQIEYYYGDVTFQEYPFAFFNSFILGTEAGEHTLTVTAYNVSKELVLPKTEIELNNQGIGEIADFNVENQKTYMSISGDLIGYASTTDVSLTPLIVPIHYDDEYDAYLEISNDGSNAGVHCTGFSNFTTELELYIITQGE